jgi:putative FmdB family regulatory protein
MPTYGYRCKQCNHTFEVFQRITDEPLTECEKCNGEVQRLLFPVGIVFKGSGFHITDYCRPKNSEDGNGRKEQSTPKLEDSEVGKEVSKSSESTK